MNNKLNQEKLEILKNDENTLVIANPGTGKTLLLAYKYAKLIKDGIKPKDILCLTFTTKAKKEMEDRIIKILEEEGIKIDYNNLNVYTFHAYALEEIGREETIESNLLRYSIYKYLKENETLRYEDDYLIQTIVPKMENLIRYLKSFGIMPQDIDIKKVKKELKEFKRLSKEEMDKFVECFVDIYNYYEQIKQNKGIDYTDMLLEFLKLKNKRKFKYVLVDELQDVNTLEADIALETGEKFFAVGDKKQAIFGFQGGSIINFKKFTKAKTFVLSQNFRSTNAILNYAKKYFISKTKDSQYIEELKELSNPQKEFGKKPIVYEVTRENKYLALAQLVNTLSKKNQQIAVIARTNEQILKISQELDKLKIDYSSTYFSSSAEAKMHIISFLKGVLSNEPNDIINAMFSPFFPITIQDAFELTKIEDETLVVKKIYEKCPQFQQIRESVKTIEDLNELFRQRILPVAICYGKEYLLASLAIYRSFNEAISLLDKISFAEVINYIKASDILADESDIKKQIVLTTVHKAKGMQFPIVIYVPKPITDKSNFQDEIVKAILRTKNINVEEELDEESLRIDFVAFSRAEQELYIITERAEDYINEFCETSTIELESIENFDSFERLKRAYVLFVNGEIEKSQKLLKEQNKWLIDFIKKYFESLEYVSFSHLEKDDPVQYLYDNILGLYQTSSAINLGYEVHVLAKAMIKEEKISINQQTEAYAKNIKTILEEIKKDYPQRLAAEQKITIPLNLLVQEAQNLKFTGVIDAIFKNEDSYLIVDWKTDKDDSRASEHRRQLEVYKRVFAIAYNVPLENIKVAIGYVGLRPIVNIGEINCKLDSAQPSKTAFETFCKKVRKILEWKKDPIKFFEDLEEEKPQDLISLAVLEQYRKEKKD